MEKEQRRRAEKEALEQRKIDDEMREVGIIWKQYTVSVYSLVPRPPPLLLLLAVRKAGTVREKAAEWSLGMSVCACLCACFTCVTLPPPSPPPPPQARRQQRKLNFLITQTELYAHFIGNKLTGLLYRILV